MGKGKMDFKTDNWNLELSYILRVYLGKLL